MSSALRLVPADRRPLAACPVAPGDRVDVTDPIPMDCGRVVRTGRYTVLRVEVTPPEHAHLGWYRLVVQAGGRGGGPALDCSDLPETHQEGSAYRRRKGLRGRPSCKLPTRVFLYPGWFTRYAGGGVATLPDHPLQND